MKTLLHVYLFLMLTLTGCKGESCVAEVEYEFLTPNVVVIKGNNLNPAGVISTQYRADRVWKKENGLLRNKRGKILRDFIRINVPFFCGKQTNISSLNVSCMRT